MDSRHPVAICWHMHQPEYRDGEGGVFLESWVLLHALKDYGEMAWHLERQPAARVAVDFSPVLLEQIEDYALRMHAWQAHRQPLGDPLLDVLLDPDSADAALHAELRRRLLLPQAPRIALGLGEYQRLRGELDAGPDARVSRDLLVWHLLAWCGQSLRCEPLWRELAAKAAGFDAVDCARLLHWIAAFMAALLPRWRALAGQGRIELLTAPYAHPLLPLLRDPAVGLGEAIPAALQAVGGAERVAWQLSHAQAVHLRIFGSPAAACWTPEAAIDAPTLDALAAAGFRWTVSSQKLLQRNLPEAQCAQLAQRPLRWRDSALQLLVRDDDLSDRIGFRYQHQPAGEAIEDLLLALVERAGPGRLVLLALDGENAWAHYPDNARDFLAGLYDRLAAHPSLRLVLPGAAAVGAVAGLPPGLRAGSWVDGRLRTWIGSPGKDHAWSLLLDARRAWLAADPERRDPCSRQLAVCEGSDWFWWLDEDYPQADVASFDRLFRHHLQRLYEMLGLPAPAELASPLARGSLLARPGPSMLSSDGLPGG